MSKIFKKTSEVVYALQKIKDEVQFGFGISRKQATIDSNFLKEMKVVS